MTDPTQLASLFAQKAELVSAVVVKVASLAEAMAYAVDICDKKEACQLLPAGCEAPVSDAAEALCETKRTKIIAAPGLRKKDFDKLAKQAGERGIECVADGLRQRLAGVDIGFGLADAGIAETGTLVIRSGDEDLRLATMICEIHVAVLPLSRLLAASADVEPLLAAWMAEPPSYAAFVTGASRTADIERVLALGVHGPLELHICLWEDA